MKRKSERTDVLIQRYERMFEEDPSSGCFIHLARLLIKKGNIKKAIEVLNKGLLHNKNNVTGRFILAKLYYDLWMIEQAKKHFEKVLKLSPDNLGAVRYLKDIYLSEGEYDTALRIVKNLLEYFPYNEEITEMLNDIEKEKKNRDSSSFSIDSDVLSVATGTDRKDPFPTTTLADIYLRQGYYAESARLYEKMLHKGLEREKKKINKRK